eukprot:6178444-Pleurochrysis_carterae.AAC.4
MTWMWPIVPSGEETPAHRPMAQECSPSRRSGAREVQVHERDSADAYGLRELEAGSECIAQWRGNLMTTRRAFSASFRPPLRPSPRIRSVPPHITVGLWRPLRETDRREWRTLKNGRR